MMRRCDPLAPPAVPRLAGLSLVQRVVEVDGHRVAAEMHLLDAAGCSGRPPVVFLHGVLTSSCLASELFDDPSRVSWISLSLPGHFGGGFAAGLSPDDIDASFYVRLIEAALEQLVGSQQVVLVGWSLGGFSALAVAATHPQRVAAVASLAGFAEPRFAGVVRVMSWMVRLPGRGLACAGGALAGGASAAAVLVCGAAHGQQLAGLPDRREQGHDQRRVATLPLPRPCRAFARARHAPQAQCRRPGGSHPLPGVDRIGQP